jgi:hypothetical protein
MRKIFFGKQLGLLVSFLGVLFFVSAWFWQDNSAGADALAENLPIDEKMLIDEGTAITQVYFYEKCQESASVTERPAKNLLKLDCRAFMNRYDRWIVESFRDKKIVMKLTVNDYCPEHKANMFLGEQDGQVAVFFGSPQRKPILKEITEVSLSSLQPQAAEEIRRGLSFSSKAEMLYILEGMQAK